MSKNTCDNCRNTCQVHDYFTSQCVECKKRWLTAKPISKYDLKFTAHGHTFKLIDQWGNGINYVCAPCADRAFTQFKERVLSNLDNQINGQRRKKEEEERKKEIQLLRKGREEALQVEETARGQKICRVCVKWERDYATVYYCDSGGDCSNETCRSYPQLLPCSRCGSKIKIKKLVNDCCETCQVINNYQSNSNSTEEGIEQLNQQKQTKEEQRKIFLQAETQIYQGKEVDVDQLNLDSEGKRILKNLQTDFQKSSSPSSPTPTNPPSSNSGNSNKNDWVLPLLLMIVGLLAVIIIITYMKKKKSLK